MGLGAILAQKESEEEEGGKIVAYVSRDLTYVQERYSQTERNALAVAWTTDEYRLYIYGKPVEIITHHSPLEWLFNNPRSKPNARIERWLMTMQDRYDYIVTYRLGKNTENLADDMTRYMAMSSDEVNNPAREAKQYVNFIESHAITKATSATDVKKATLEDGTLQRVIENLLKGCWNEHPRSGLLLMGTKLISPKKFQDRVVELGHQGHQGIVKTKRLIREKLWFPGIDPLVEKKVKRCLACQASTYPPKSYMEPQNMSKLDHGNRSPLTNVAHFHQATTCWSQ